MRRVIVIAILVNFITLLLPIFPVFKGMIIEPGYYMGQMSPALVYSEGILNDYPESRLVGYLMLGAHVICASALALLLCHLEKRFRRARGSEKTEDAEP